MKSTATARKSTKVENVFVVALTAAIASLGNMPAAPAFDEEAIRAPLTAAGLPADYVTKAIKDLRYKHETTHGDTSAKSLHVILSALLTVEGVDGESLMRAAKSAAGIVRKERVELTDAQKEEVKALFIAGGPNGQRSVLAEKFNVADATIFNLTANLKRNETPAAAV